MNWTQGGKELYHSLSTIQEGWKIGIVMAVRIVKNKVTINPFPTAAFKGAFVPLYDMKFWKRGKLKVGPMRTLGKKKQ